MSALGKTAADTRRCVFCGKHMAAHLTQCPFCREAVPQVQLTRRTGPNGRQQIRRGLLYMLLGAVIHYFAGGYGAPIFQIPLPAPAMPLVTQYLTPLLFLGGLGLTLYGLFLKIRS
jgi:DNA-binding helix-hairpin-helix protein with protein kinase domain